jgi:hypothetical protein
MLYQQIVLEALYNNTPKTVNSLILDARVVILGRHGCALGCIVCNGLMLKSKSKIINKRYSLWI